MTTSGARQLAPQTAHDYRIRHLYEETARNAILACRDTRSCRKGASHHAFAAYLGHPSLRLSSDQPESTWHPLRSPVVATMSQASCSGYSAWRRIIIQDFGFYILKFG